MIITWLCASLSHENTEFAEFGIKIYFEKIILSVLYILFGFEYLDLPSCVSVHSNVVIFLDIFLRKGMVLTIVDLSL